MHVLAIGRTCPYPPLAKVASTGGYYSNHSFLNWSKPSQSLAAELIQNLTRLLNLFPDGQEVS